MIERVTELSAKGVEARLAGVLLGLASQIGRTSLNGVEIAYPVTRNDMAEMTGVTYFTVSRVLSAWQKQGIVRLGRERVTVVELHRLAQIAG
jgi:CRP/FNR family transcriptional regulator, nitrogen oxide reductase regulator